MLNQKHIKHRGIENIEFINQNYTIMITQKYLNDLSYQIIGCAIEVHKELGPGLLESVYQTCLIEEFKMKNLNIRSEQAIPILYKGKSLNSNLVLDLIVEEQVVVELKTVESIKPVHKAQLLTYLKLTNKPKGLLFNFYTDNIKDNVVSYVSQEFAKLQKE